jgi:hypothetical protein
VPRGRGGGAPAAAVAFCMTPLSPDLLLLLHCCSPAAPGRFLPLPITYRDPEALTGYTFRDVQRPRTAMELEMV